MGEGSVVIELTKDEAVVFFEWLSVNEDDERLVVGNSAEELVFFKILGHLERTLVEPLRPDYKRLLETARRRILEKGV